MKAVIRVHRQTGQIAGVTIVSVDADIAHVQPTATHDVVEIPCDHPAIHAHQDWEVVSRQLRRRVVRETT